MNRRRITSWLAALGVLTVAFAALATAVIVTAAQLLAGFANLAVALFGGTS